MRENGKKDNKEEYQRKKKGKEGRECMTEKGRTRMRRRRE